MGKFKALFSAKETRGSRNCIGFFDSTVETFTVLFINFLPILTSNRLSFLILNSFREDSI